MRKKQHNIISSFLFYCAEIDLNGMDNMGDDSDSVGNAPRTTRSAAGGGGGGGTGGAGFTMPTKEKRKPFFKKVAILSFILIRVPVPSGKSLEMLDFWSNFQALESHGK